ncbi:MAG TPA: aspartate kinase [SAR202 cluster bacterium]|jgi:aspartate kinase|nr:aspartate kinase [SAR202 cluster bacterium]MDP7413839.1 aspartate kinase [SAR202 cluster bacterium]HJO81536.1 aspartate kinase [SAR202 cluster bacterium]
MALVVQKYGGSSLATAEHIKNVAGRIGRTFDDGNQVVVVVSAMGDTTDDLIDLAESVADQPDQREMDVLLSTGELVSCTIMAMALRSLGYKAISLSGAQAGIETTTSYGQAQIAGMNPDRIMSELDADHIVIVAGFQGVTPDLNVTTLGRGGSDTTAVAVAAALRAARCEVYTDVEGIYTADPRRVPKAQKLEEIGFEEMLELASYGVKMNPRSIELGMVYDTPILVASSTDDGPGTLIHGETDMNRDVGEIRNRVGGIATDTNVAKITVRNVRDRPGIAANLFEPLADQGISVDVIVQNASVDGATDMTFTVKRTDLDRARHVVEEVSREFGGAEVITASDLAKLSIVGTGMLDATGYASKMFRTLADNEINIEMITTSEIRITCIVAEGQLDRAARALHSAFDLDGPESGATG